VPCRVALALIGTVALTSACGGDEPPPAGGSSGGVPFTVWVFDERLNLDGDEAPIANARVALDPPSGGERVVKTTEPDGHVTFAYPGDPKAGVSITILSDAHVFLTMLEASPETARARPNTKGKPPSDLVVFPPRLDNDLRARSIELRGSVLGKRDPSHVVTLGASALPRLGVAQALESTYVLRAPKARPFFVLGHETKTLVDDDGVVVDAELVKSFRLELAPRDGDQRLDLDLASLPALQSKVVHVRAEPPEGFAPGLGTRAYAAVESADSGLLVGIFSRANEAPDGRGFVIEVTVSDTELAPERILRRAVLTRVDGSSSVRTEEGPFVEGEVLRDFPAPPSIPDPDGSRSVHDPIPLDGFPPGADLVAEVHAGGQLLWILEGPPGGPRAKSFTIPYRDEVTSADVQVFALSLSARRERVVLPSWGQFHRFVSSFRDVRLRKR
jgi:hypothetical protein